MSVTRGCGLTGLDQTRRGVLAERFEHAIARARLVGVDHRLVDERHEQVEHLDRRDVSRGRDLFGRVERKATCEHREATEHRAFPIRQQVIAPVDRCLERLLARQHRPRATGEQAETIVEARGDLFDGQPAHARRRELDRERDSLESVTDLRHSGRVVARDREVRSRPRRAVEEELHRVEVRQRLDRGRLDRIRRRHRRHPPGCLAGDTEGLAAGGDQRQ
jgi:hypothetical protein